MVDGHAKGEVFKAVMREALAARPDLDVSDLAWRWRAIAAARRLTADPPSDRAAEVAGLLVDAPLRQTAPAQSVSKPSGRLTVSSSRSTWIRSVV